MAVRVHLAAASLVAAIVAAPAAALAKTFAGPMPGQLIGSVPEPATWALMLAGFGLVGALLRAARRRKPATA